MTTRTTIKFANTNQSDFVKDLRTSVKDYFTENGISQNANTNMVLKTIFMFSIYLGPYLLMLTGVITNPLTMLFMWIIMAFGMSGIGFSVMHDANHRSYSKNQKVNKFLSLSLYLLGGFPPTWQYQHNTLHHGFTNIDDHDEDIDPGKILRLSPNKPYFKYHRFQQWYAWFLYGLMTITWAIDKDFKQLYRYKNEGITNHAKKSFGTLLAILIATKIFYYFYILVLPIILLPIPWWTILIYYFIMHFISGVLLGVIFQTAHVMPSSEYPLPDDEGNLENNWAIHQLLTTTDYAPNSKLFSWFIGGLNFQIEHHLFPNICHVHYKKIRHIVEEKARKYNLPYYVQPTFPRAVKDHFNMLKNLGRSKLVMGTRLRIEDC